MLPGSSGGFHRDDVIKGPLFPDLKLGATPTKGKQIIRNVSQLGSCSFHYINFEKKCKVNYG